MNELLTKLNLLQNAYYRLSKANPDPDSALANANQIFGEVLILLGDPAVASHLDNFLIALRNSPNFPEVAISYLDQNRANFIKSETELVRSMRLRPSEINDLINVFLRRYTDGRSIQDSDELRERLQLMHTSYCTGIIASRGMPKKIKKATRLKLSNGVVKMVAGTGLLSANSFFLATVPISSPAAIVSCLTGIATFYDGLDKLHS
jgi:hypothetical protein